MVLGRSGKRVWSHNRRKQSKDANPVKKETSPEESSKIWRTPPFGFAEWGISMLWIFRRGARENFLLLPCGIFWKKDGQGGIGLQRR